MLSNEMNDMTSLVYGSIVKLGLNTLFNLHNELYFKH